MKIIIAPYAPKATWKCANGHLTDQLSSHVPEQCATANCDAEIESTKRGVGAGVSEES